MILSWMQTSYKLNMECFNFFDLEIIWACKVTICLLRSISHSSWPLIRVNKIAVTGIILIALVIKTQIMACSETKDIAWSMINSVSFFALLNFVLCLMSQRKYECFWVLVVAISLICLVNRKRCIPTEFLSIWALCNKKDIFLLMNFVSEYLRIKAV